METGFITPIQVFDSIEDLNRAQQTGNTENSLFRNIFDNVLQTVEEAELHHEEQEYLLATGQIDDAHTVTIAAAEAQLAVDMLVQLRNKAIEAYNELMRITV